MGDAERDEGHRKPGRDGRERNDREARRRPDEHGDSAGAGPENSSLGKGDSSAVAGSDVQQPEIAEGPVEGLQPGEKVERGPWTPPLEVDPPSGDDLPRDAAGEPEAVRKQKEEGGP